MFPCQSINHRVTMGCLADAVGVEAQNQMLPVVAERVFCDRHGYEKRRIEGCLC